MPLFGPEHTGKNEINKYLFFFLLWLHPLMGGKSTMEIPTAVILFIRSFGTREMGAGS